MLAAKAECREEFERMAYRSGANRKLKAWEAVSVNNNRLPTPNSRDWKNATAKEWDNPKKTRNLNRYVAKQYERSEAKEERLGQLNPDWVEALMGYPQGWTDIKKESSTEADFPASWLDGTWEKGIPRTAKNEKNRTRRLKALGNAVVPLIPMLIWRLVSRAVPSRFAVAEPSFPFAIQ